MRRTGVLGLLIEAAEAALAERRKRTACGRRSRSAAPRSGAPKARLEGRARGGCALARRLARRLRRLMARRRREAEPAVGAVRQTLKALEELRAALKDCAELEHRIDAMERDKRLFAEEVAKAGAALGVGQDDDAGRLADAIDRARGRGAGKQAPSRREEAGAGDGARQACPDRRSARGQCEARLGDDRLLRRREPCRSRRQTRRLQPARRVARRDRQGDARHPRRQPRELVRGGARRARSRRSRRRSSRNSETWKRARRRTTRSTPSASPPTARRRDGSRRSAATTLSRGSRRTGARSWK